MAHKTLVGLLKNPLVMDYINPSIFDSLNKTRQIDHVIGAVQEALYITEEEARLCPLDKGSQLRYQNLKRGFEKLKKEYPLYFKGASPIDETETKKSAYKACNGF